MNDVDSEVRIDEAETLIAHLICANARSPATDARILKCEPLFPTLTYTMQLGSDERLLTTDPTLLLNSVQDLLGGMSQIAILSGGEARWMCYRKVRRAPSGWWCASNNADWYECHFRIIQADGSEHYQVDMQAIDKRGRPMPVVRIGAMGSLHRLPMIVASASVIEDAHRPNTLLATIKESTAIRVPVPIDEHRDLFALRDAPLTKAGRRKAIIHWVAAHSRARASIRTQVSPHWRGARELSIDGLSVALSPNA